MSATTVVNGDAPRLQEIIAVIQQQMQELQKVMQHQASEIERLRHEVADLQEEADTYRKSLTAAMQLPFEFTPEEIQALRDKGLSLRQVVDELVPAAES
jgi:predicted  nucleic acid-binding Zn-ribbon protein